MDWLLFFLILTAAIVINAFYDHYVVEELKIGVDHMQRSFLRFCVFTGNAFMFSAELSHLIVLVLLQSAIFWFGFDLLLNHLRGKNLFYVGKTSVIDKHFNDKGEAIIYFKLGYLLLSIALVILVI